MKTGILIAVRDRTITEITFDDIVGNTFIPNQSLPFPSVRIDGANDLYIDNKDQFALIGQPMSFQYAGLPIVGNGVILGYNLATGESTNTTLTIAEVEANVVFL